MIKFIIIEFFHNLSMKLERSGISGFNPFLALIEAIKVPVFDVASNGSPETSAQ